MDLFFMRIIVKINKSDDNTYIDSNDNGSVIRNIDMEVISNFDGQNNNYGNSDDKNDVDSECNIMIKIEMII